MHLRLSCCIVSDIFVLEFQFPTNPMQLGNEERAHNGIHLLQLRTLSLIIHPTNDLSVSVARNDLPPNGYIDAQVQTFVKRCIK